MFLISATMLIGSGVLYVCFADSTLQDWNGHSTRAGDKELKLLNQEIVHKEPEKKPLNDDKSNENPKK